MYEKQQDCTQSLYVFHTHNIAHPGDIWAWAKSMEVSLTSLLASIHGPSVTNARQADHACHPLPSERQLGATRPGEVCRVRRSRAHQDDGSIVHVKQDDAEEGDEMFQYVAAPEPEQLPALAARDPARERQRRLDELPLGEIALEKEEVQIRRRLIEDEE
jgi:hypothetical protein